LYSDVLGATRIAPERASDANPLTFNSLRRLSVVGGNMPKCEGASPPPLYLLSCIFYIYKNIYINKIDKKSDGGKGHPLTLAEKYDTMGSRGTPCITKAYRLTPLLRSSECLRVPPSTHECLRVHSSTKVDTF